MEGVRKTLINLDDPLRGLLKRNYRDTILFEELCGDRKFIAQSAAPGMDIDRRRLWESKREFQ